MNSLQVYINIVAIVEIICHTFLNLVCFLNTTKQQQISTPIPYLRQCIHVVDLSQRKNIFVAWFTLCDSTVDLQRSVPTSFA